MMVVCVLFIVWVMWVILMCRVVCGFVGVRFSVWKLCVGCCILSRLSWCLILWLVWCVWYWLVLVLLVCRCWCCVWNCSVVSLIVWCCRKCCVYMLLFVCWRLVCSIFWCIWCFLLIFVIMLRLVVKSLLFGLVLNWRSVYEDFGYWWWWFFWLGVVLWFG